MVELDLQKVKMEEIKQILKGCLEYEENNRISIDQILKILEKAFIEINKYKNNNI